MPYIDMQLSRCNTELMARYKWTIHSLQIIQKSILLRHRGPDTQGDAPIRHSALRNTVRSAKGLGRSF